MPVLLPGIFLSVAPFFAFGIFLGSGKILCFEVFHFPLLHFPIIFCIENNIISIFFIVVTETHFPVGKIFRFCKRRMLAPTSRRMDNISGGFFNPLIHLRLSHYVTNLFNFYINNNKSNLSSCNSCLFSSCNSCLLSGCNSCLI
jgi:hypothetical protein